MIPRVFVKIIAEILVRLAETNKPIFTLLFSIGGAIGFIIGRRPEMFSAMFSATPLQNILVGSATFGGLGAFIDFYIGKSGQARVKSALETFALRALFYADKGPSDKRPPRAKLYQISLVKRVSRNSIWTRVTQALVLTAVALYIADFTETSQVYIGLLVALAALPALDAGIIWWRAAKGEYGLSKLEVKEVARLIAAARRRRDNGGDPGTFVRIFPDEVGLATDWVWAHQEGVRS
jgi:hypothetical protein